MNYVKFDYTRLMKAWMCFAIALGIVMTGLMSALASPFDTTGAEDRAATMIAMANGKANTNSAGVDLSKLTGEDVQFLGVYLSNFMAPYYTEMGFSGGATEKGAQDFASENNKRMQQALTDQLGFTEPDAKATVTFISKQYDSTKAPATWYFSDKPTAKTSAGMYKATTTSNSYAELQKMVSGYYGYGDGRDGGCMASGGLKNRAGRIKCLQSYYSGMGTGDLAKANHDMVAVYKDKKKFAHLVVGDRVVFSVDLYAETVTPSVASFIAAGGLAEPKAGYGTNVFDIASTDPKTVLKQLDKAVADGKAAELFKSSIWGTILMADAFGNISVSGGNVTYLLLPSSANPYIYMDSSKATGSQVPTASTVLMGGMAGSGRTFSSYAGGKCTVNSTGATALSYSRNESNQVTVVTDSGLGGAFSREKGVKYRMSRGNSQADTNSLGGLLGNNGYGKALQEIFKYQNDTGSIKNYDKSILSKRVNGFMANAGVEDMIWFYYGYPGNSGEHYGLPGTAVPCTSKVVAVDHMKLYEGGDVKKNMATLQYMDSVNSDGTAVGKENYQPGTAQKWYGIPTKEESTTGYSPVIDPKSVMDTPTAFSLYVTYVVAQYGNDAAKKELGFAFDFEGLPAIDGNPEYSAEDLAALEAANSATAKDEMDDDIRNWLWYLLNPSKGLDYVTTLFENKAGAFVIDTHNDIVGTSNAPVLAGSTKYTGFSGYVTMVNMGDMEITQTVYDLYQDNYIYLVLLFVVIAGVYAMVGMLTVQGAFGSLIIFSFLAFMPLHAINWTIEKTNTISDSIYGEKFTYWALVQNQTYSKMIDDAAQSDSYQNYLQTQWGAVETLDITGTGTGGNNKGNDSVVVKWQSPKKLNALSFSSQGLDKIVTEGKVGSASDGGGEALSEAQSQIAGNFASQLNKSMSGESYLAEEDVTYLYRSYIDINNYSRFIYRGIADGKQDYNTSPDTSKWDKSLKNAWSTREADYSAAVDNGYNLPNKGTAAESPLRVVPAVGSRIVSDTFSQVGEVTNQTTNNTLGVDPRAFSMSISDFTGGNAGSLTESVKINADAYYKKSAEKAGSFDPAMNGGYTNEDYTSLTAYALMSESPMFYYSWNLYDQGLNPGSTDNGSGSDGYQGLVLGTDGQSYFYNTEGNGEMRDFLDMRTLFTYVIPYLHQGNSVVTKYDSVHGLVYNEGVPSAPGYESDFADDPETLRKYWQNRNTAYLYSIYSPWVDLMYDSGYADAETIQVQGESVTIDDPLNPASYPENRPMVFSKSEQVDYGIKDSDLTEVERRIQATHQGSMERMFNMLNYYNFDDSVLNTGAAMQTTFEFNKNFSDSNVLGTGVQLYPQSYELKNFSYDAYLRLILANSTGESITDNKNAAGETDSSGSAFYTKIMHNSNLFTGAVMVVLDIMSVYLLPAVKILILLLLITLALLKTLSLALRIEQGKALLQSIWECYIKPLIIVSASFIGFAWVVSLMMSNGNTAVTGYDGVTLSFGDPIVAMLFLVLLNAVLIALLLWAGYMMANGVKQTGRAIGQSFQAVGTGAVYMARNGFKGAFTGAAAGAAAGVGASNSAAGAAKVTAPASPSAVKVLSANQGTVRVEGRADKERRRNIGSTMKPAQSSLFNRNSVDKAAEQDKRNIAAQRKNELNNLSRPAHPSSKPVIPNPRVNNGRTTNRK